MVFASAMLPADAALTGVIAGVVVDGDTHRSIAGASVTIVSPSAHYQATTDAKGAFSIAGVVFETYTVSVSAPGYLTFVNEGITVTGDEVTRLAPALSHGSQVIGRSRARSLSSAFQPDQTVDRYTLNSAGIDQLLGKSFDTNGAKLLSELPGVTVDRNGTPLIRGGTSFETALTFEGIDYTTPQRSVVNRNQNAGNSNLLNGAGSLEIIPGGGDATRGDTGTGLIAFTAKRGTYPGFGTIDAELSAIPARVKDASFIQGGFEYGIATKNNSISNYVTYINDDQIFQYGPYGTAASSLSASAIAPDVNLNNNVNAHFGAQYTSAAFNTAIEWSRDFLDNLIVRFGHDQNQSLQFFVQSQAVREYLNYGGVTGLTTPGVALVTGGGGSLIPGIFGENGGVNTATIDTNIAASGVFSNYPGRLAPGTGLLVPGEVYSPFAAFKIEHDYSPNGDTAIATRFYRTYSNQQEQQPDQGLDVLSNGGARNGVALDVTRTLGNAKHLLQFGGKYEFASPFGQVLDNVDYVGALEGVHGVEQDFVTPIPAVQIPGTLGGNLTNVTTSGTPGCSGTPITRTGNDGSISNVIGAGSVCGYLGKYFPNGIPPIPAEVEVPTAQQQTFAYYLQDTWSPSAKIKALLGMRLDGYNFLIPNDPQNPPAVDGIRHQRLFEPHAGLSYKFGNSDALRVNFGRSLSIPLPTFIGSDIDRSAYSAFNNVPSFDSATGKPATYCGPGLPATASNGVTTFTGNQTCTNYADQLYWLYRNLRFGSQEQVNYPLRGATFTNYDLSYSHEFRDGTAFKLTPFYRRGYDVVEVTRTLLGRDPITDAEILSPEVYSNFGMQKATGVEIDVTKIEPFGLSGQFSATYINQIGNDPPGTFLPTQSLALGLLYQSPTLAPFQATLALTYKTRSGWRINPVVNLVYGYPYGKGVEAAQTIDGQIVYVPVTDATVSGNQGASFANGQVDPQNPGTIGAPNIIASAGTEGLRSGAGSLRSSGALNVDLTIEHRAPGSRFTYGLAVTNLFNYTSDVPVVNNTHVTVPIANGINASTGTLTANAPAVYSSPTSVGPSYLPYILFPNQAPLAARLYVQLAL